MRPETRQWLMDMQSAGVLIVVSGLRTMHAKGAGEVDLRRSIWIGRWRERTR